MRRSISIERQGLKASVVKRLSELEQENSVLKLLYTVLLVKPAARKDGFERSLSVC